MVIPRLFVDTDLQSGQKLHLPPERSNYLCRVLRIATGQPLWLFNGRGGAFQASLLKADAKQALVQLGEWDGAERESALPIELGIALSKGTRFEQIIQKSTELGVAIIQPLLTERVQVRLNRERVTKRLVHWRAAALALLLDPCAERRLGEIAAPGCTVHLYVGPEGGLTEAEVTAAQRYGFQPVRLGPRVLRTETAPVAAIASMQVLWGDF
ncbi:MAG: 16S rRNA (uracil(1498)-N(3))-methyltransferase [Cellvibrionales bacterium]|nr:16S rRNA (uracil(1498)-N(3))-methyltransferase [Cellvibrionales bacterium]